MDVRTAIGVELKRRAVEEELETVLKEATEAETAEAAAAKESGAERPTARARFQALGKRVIALSDGRETLKSRGDYAGEQHSGFTEIGLEGLGIAAKARESYTPGSLRGRELDYVQIEWVSSAHVTDTPLARQEVGLSEVRPHNVTPETYGMLRLMEQSVSVAELAREGASVFRSGSSVN